MRHDYILVGGGLQNGLCALAILARQPHARIALVERDGRLGGNHTWCFHEGDLPSTIAATVAPLVVQRWPGYDVVFPGFARQIRQAYAAVTSERLDEILRARFAAAPNAELLLEAAAQEVRPGVVVLSDGRRLDAAAVVDARGPAPAEQASATVCGYQKFVGLEVRLARPDAPGLPTLMDATVAQEDGYRFFYVLPLAPDRVLIEDTYFTDGPALDFVAIEARVRSYAAARGWEIASVLRRESGVLPLPWATSAAAEAAPIEVSAEGVLLRGGWRGGWFHPTTGYSFPVAARLAAFVAERAPGRVTDGFAAFHAAHRRQARFAQRLNRLLFRHFEPAERWNVLARFYRLPEATVRRFYALELTGGDKARVLCGQPPRGMKLWRARPAAQAAQVPS